MENLMIREILPEELGILDKMLYEAIFKPEGCEPVPHHATQIPEINIYIDGFGSRKDDYCLVADLSGRIIGAVWVRIDDRLFKEPGIYAGVFECSEKKLCRKNVSKVWF